MHVERSLFDFEYWQSKLLPALQSFYAENVLKEITGGARVLEKYGSA